MMRFTEGYKLEMMGYSEQWMTSTHQQQMLISLGPVLISMPMLIIIRISLNESFGLEDFSVADFVDYIQTLANVRAVNGGTQSRLGYAERILEENEINLGAATSRIMDADMAHESTKMASQNVLMQAAASMVTQANNLNAVVLSLLQ